MPAAVPIAMVASSVVGGVMANKSAKKAAGAQADATNASISAQEKSDERYYAQQEQVRQALNPYVQAGYQSIGYSPQQIQMYTGTPSGGVQYGSAGNEVGNGQILREKPSYDFPSGAGGGFPSRTGSQPSTESFASGYNQAQPMQNTLLNAGQGAVPQLQNFAEGGQMAYKMQQDIAGVNGPEAQQNAYKQVESDPAVAYMMEKAKQGILSGGSATGNLNSGRTVNALMEYQPEILSNAINQKYSQLAPMSASGLNTSQYLTGTGGNVAQNLYGSAQTALENTANRGLSAAGGAPIGQAGASPTANLLQQGGASAAGAHLAQGTNVANALNSGVSNYFTAKKMGMFDSPLGHQPPAPTQQYGDYGSGQGMFRNTGL